MDGAQGLRPESREGLAVYSWLIGSQWSVLILDPLSSILCPSSNILSLKIYALVMEP